METSGGDFDQNVVLRNLLANIQTGDKAGSGGTTDCMAQLLAAAVAQFGNSSVAVSEEPRLSVRTGEQNLDFNPEETSVYDIDDGVNIPAAKRKPLCVKFPVELRKRIIAMRKEGKKCVEVAKELHVSVSGAQKVWERFLATGTVHDRKPNTYAGRPRKYQSAASLDTHYVETIEEYKVNENQVEVCDTNDSEASMIVTYSGGSDVFTEGALDVPGATVEVVETEPQLMSASMSSRHPQKGAPAYRQRLLLKLIQDCPLAALRDDPSLAADNPHVMNLSSSMNKPLYMEYVLGHPFGKVPFPRPFDGDTEEAKVILSDPVNPIGREMLATLGYSTKVHFNACCKPSPLFDKEKLLSILPFSLGPGYLAETMQSVLQLLLDMCTDPAAALERIPEGNGLTLTAGSNKGVSKKVWSPGKLSDYWCQLYSYASLLECCENFLSATKPSAPCLLCHPFESVVKTLEIQDDDDDEVFPTYGHSLSSDHDSDQQVEVQVLQSGQIEFSTLSNKDCTSSASNLPLSMEREQLVFTATDVSTESERINQQTPATRPSSHIISVSAPPQPSPIQDPPLIIRRSHTARRSAESSASLTRTNQSTNQPSYSGDTASTRTLRSSKRLPQSYCNAHKESTTPKRGTYNLRHTQNHASPPPDKKAKHSEDEPVNNHPMQWSIEEVCSFISRVPNCDYEHIFREHEVDGESLMTLDPEMMIKLLNVKAGPALRIHKQILLLKKQNNISP